MSPRLLAPAAARPNIRRCGRNSTGRSSLTARATPPGGQHRFDKEFSDTESDTPDAPDKISFNNSIYQVVCSFPLEWLQMFGMDPRTAGSKRDKQERVAAAQKFHSKEAEEEAKKVPAKTFTPGLPDAQDTTIEAQGPKVGAPTPEQIRAIKAVKVFGLAM